MRESKVALVILLLMASNCWGQAPRNGVVDNADAIDEDRPKQSFIVLSAEQVRAAFGDRAEDPDTIEKLVGALNLLGARSGAEFSNGELDRFVIFTEHDSNRKVRGYLHDIGMQFNDVIGLRVVRVYQLKFAASSDVQEKLLELKMRGVNVVAEPRTNSVVISASQWQHVAIQDAIHNLEGNDSTTSLVVLPLEIPDRVGPQQVVELLQKLFEETDSNAPQITLDEAAKQLIVRGTADQIRQIKIILSKMK